MKKKFNLLRNIWDFLKVRKVWWLLPLIIMLVLLGILIIFASSSKLIKFE